MKHLYEALNNFRPLVITHATDEKGNLCIITEYTKDHSQFCKLEEGNKISFKIQDGVISENGINGIQASDLIRFNLELIRSLNNAFPCRENSITITKLEEAIASQDARTINRIQRNVEGVNKL